MTAADTPDDRAASTVEVMARELEQAASDTLHHEAAALLRRLAAALADARREGAEAMRERAAAKADEYGRRHDSLAYEARECGRSDDDEAHRVLSAACTILAAAIRALPQREGGA